MTSFVKIVGGIVFSGESDPDPDERRSLYTPGVGSRGGRWPGEWPTYYIAVTLKQLKPKIPL